MKKAASNQPPMTDEISVLDDAAFLQKVGPELEQLEKIRKAKNLVYLFRKKAGIIGGLIATPFAGFADWWLITACSGDDCGAGLTAVMWGLIYGWIIVPKKQYAKAYKKEVLPDIARLFGDFTYDADGKIPASEMKPSKILPRHDRYKSEDYFKGQYKGTALTFSEIKLKQRRSSGKRTRYVTVFKGLAILIDLPEGKFSGHTILIRDKSPFMEWFKEKGTGLERANLVDPEFEKIYDVFTNDQVEARYLIDPVMIERLKALTEIYESDDISAACYDGRMLVLLPSRKNFFEPADIKVKATDPQSVLKMRREVGHILRLVDHLELYDKRAFL